MNADPTTTTSISAAVTPPAGVPASSDETSAPQRTMGPPLDNTEQLPGRIMIIDDEPVNIVVARKHLERAGYHEFKSTTDSTVAFNLIQSTKPDVVLLDVNMPEVHGIDILRQIRLDEETCGLPVLILTANDDYAIKVTCLELGATDFLVKPVDSMELVPRVRNALRQKSYQDKLADYAAELEREIRMRTRELERSRAQAIYSLARAAELRDNDTGNHVIRVGRYAGIIARNLGFNETYVNDIELAAQLHDVGKIAIPDSILLKPGRLEPEEFEFLQSHVKHGRRVIQPYLGDDAAAMRMHVVSGSEVLQNGSSLMRLAAMIAQTHHEKFDGSGYPIGLAGDDIPIEGRITAVADVYDALSSERPYKKAMPRHKCFEILEEGRGRHFDPTVLDAFFSGREEIIRVQVEYVDNP